MSPSKRYWHDQVGYNYRITNLQAALGLAQLQRIDHLLARKRAIFERYRYHLSQLSCIRLNFTDENIENSYWMVTIELLGYTEQKREQFMAFLKDKGIDNRPFFYPMSDMPMYADGQTHTPIAHEVAAQGVNLPSYFDMLDEDIDYICEVIVRYLGRSLRQLTTVSRTEPRVEKTVSSLSLAS